MEASPTDMGPRSGGKQLDLAFNIYFKNLGKLLLAALAVILPLTVLIMVLDSIALLEPDDPFDQGVLQIGETTRFVDMSTYNLIMVVQQIIGFLAYLVVIGVTYRAASEAYLGREVDAGASVRFAAPKIHSILWLTILTGIAIVIGLLALIVGAIYVGVALAVAIPALMVEDIRGFKALQRSFDLVKGNWWRTFGVLLVSGLFVFFVAFLAGLVAAAANGLAENQITVWIVIVNLVLGLANALTAALVAVVATVIYYDLRIRKEGFDVEMLADRLGDGAPGPIAPAGTATGGGGFEPSGPAPVPDSGSGSVPPPGAPRYPGGPAGRSVPPSG